MSIKRQRVNQFGGFSAGSAAGEYFQSQGMKKSQFGARLGWATYDDNAYPSGAANSSVLSTLGLITWLQAGKFNLGGGGGNIISSMFGMDTNGKIFHNSSVFTGSGWTDYLYQSNDLITAGNNGMVVDQKNRLLYAGWRYIGCYDPATENYTTGTVQVTNGSAAIVGTGTTFTSGMVGKAFRVAGSNVRYKVATYTDATHITLTDTYGETGGSGKLYTIFSAWTDQKWDLGASQEYAKPMIQWQDSILVAYANKIAKINTLSDSIDLAALTIATGGWVIKDISSIPNGIVIGANGLNGGMISLWDGRTDAYKTDPIYIDEKINSVKRYGSNCLVVTDKAVYVTNGYSMDMFKRDFLNNETNATEITSAIAYPQGAAVLDNKLVFMGGKTGQTREDYGVYMLDLDTKLLEFACPVSKEVWSLGCGAIARDPSTSNIHLGMQTTNAVYRIAYLNSSPMSGFWISPILGDGSGMKTGDTIVIPYNIPEVDSSSSTLPSYTIDVKIFNFRRRLFSYAQQKSDGADTTKITINGTVAAYADAQVGDEVTILSGANAGDVRHIKTITGKGTSTEVWTVDVAFSNNLLTNDAIQLTPFKRVGTVTVSQKDDTINSVFDCKLKPTGQKFLIKVLIKDVVYTKGIELQELEFYYNERGIKW